MLIFRVEDPESGDGPYNCMRDWPEQGGMTWAHADSTHQPPWADARLNGIKRWSEKCACDSPESLLQWFDGYWAALHAAGFVVRILQARSARVGDNGQVVYSSTSARELDRLDPETFHALFSED